MKNLLVIVGPTASGKSDLAVELAKKLNGEVISADSRQVYRGLDIGSGKITRREMKDIPHHLLDIASPRRTFTVADYQKLARQKVDKIWRQDKLPIIVGGTGFYIDALVDGTMLPEVTPDKKLRTTLAKKSPAELFSILKKLDPKRARNIDGKNPHRMIRAIEIATHLGQVPPIKKSPLSAKITFIGIKPPDNILRQRIKTRLAKRLRQGLIKEVEALHQAGLSFKKLESFGLEYKYVALYLQNKLSKKEMVSQLETAINHYAKRQMTWFKRNKKIKWFPDPKTALDFLGNKITGN